MFSFFDCYSLDVFNLAFFNIGLQSIKPLVERGGYIPFCDHLCPPNVKVKNYLYYLDLKEKMFGLKAN